MVKKVNVPGLTSKFGGFNKRNHRVDESFNGYNDTSSTNDLYRLVSVTVAVTVYVFDRIKFPFQYFS